MDTTVLVVEDDPATVAMIGEILELVHYRMLHALGAEALALARDRQPDVILLDINLPEMSGPEISRHLRADAATAHIPIVAMSSELTRTGVPPDMSCDGCLPKPFALDALYAIVDRWARTAHR